MTPWPGKKNAPTHPAPAKPKPTPKPPKPPKPSPSSSADDGIFLAVALLRVDLARPVPPRQPSKPPRKPINTKPIRGAQSPACPSPVVVPGFCPSGGPVMPSTREVEKGPTPGPAVAISRAACESTGAVVAPGAGDSFSVPQPPPFWVGAR